MLPISPDATDLVSRLVACVSVSPEPGPPQGRLPFFLSASLTSCCVAAGPIRRDSDSM